MANSLVILTGHSQGLGKALLDYYLDKSGVEVIGISRKLLGINSPRLKEISLDLSDLDLLENQLDLIFPDSSYDEILLINNAGSIGEIKSVGLLDSKRLQSLMNLNLLAPALLTNAFVARFQGLKNKRVVCNISSGAAHKPMEGWASYCSSKAALAMFTQVCQKENRNSRIRFFSIAPGIIDTPMQAEIRKSDEKNFPDLARFLAYKSEGKLASGIEVARKIGFLLEHSSSFEEVIQDVRNFEIP